MCKWIVEAHGGILNYTNTKSIQSKINSLKEDHEARVSWHNSLTLYQNFFTYFEQKKFESPYYTALYHLISGLVADDKYSMKDKWKLFDRYISNFVLIPHHSAALTLPSNFNPLQLAYIRQRFQNTLRFPRKNKSSLFIFNGNSWYVLLIKHKFIQNYEKIKINEKFNLYLFEIEGIPFVLFDKFFQRHFWGITDYHRAVIIPELIRKKYDIRFNG